MGKALLRNSTAKRQRLLAEADGENAYAASFKSDDFRVEDPEQTNKFDEMLKVIIDED